MFLTVGFQYLLCQFCDIGFVSLQAFQIPSSIMEASKHSKILFDKRASRFIQINDQRQRIQRCNEPQKIYFQDKSRKTAIQQRWPSWFPWIYNLVDRWNSHEHSWRLPIFCEAKTSKQGIFKGKKQKWLGIIKLFRHAKGRSWSADQRKDYG